MMRRFVEWGRVGKITRGLVLAWLVFGVAGALDARALSLEAAESPATSLSLTVSAIRSAKRSLLLNIYELSSSDVADALLERIRAGVRVEILEEGQPVGGMSATARGIQNQLVQAMRSSGQDDHLYEMTSRASQDLVIHASKRRFRFDHAKYAVIDGRDLLIGSENYSPTGNPHAGVKGNRGWEVLLHDVGIATELARIFRLDTDLSAGDLIDRTEAERACIAPLCQLGDLDQETLEPADPNAAGPWFEPTPLQADSVERITSPDGSLKGLLGLMSSAKRTLDIQQMTFDPGWGKIADRSPLLDAAIAAARRGVRVRVLLNDERVFTHPGHPGSSKNLKTVQLLNEVAEEEDLDLTAMIADLKRMGVTYIHNKGVLVDGDRTLISSINWGNNAVLNNREAAVVIRGAEVFDHYETLFENDWKASGGELGVRASDDPAGTAYENCPEHLKITLEFGALRSLDPENVSFEPLSGTRYSGIFARVGDGSTCCILSDSRSARRTEKGHYVEIRRKATGEAVAVLEGYTSDGRVYSVRTILGSKAPLDAVYDAGVFDGSGPAREKLGTAVLGLGTEVLSELPEELLAY